MLPDMEQVQPVTPSAQATSSFAAHLEQLSKEHYREVHQLHQKVRSLRSLLVSQQKHEQQHDWLGMSISSSQGGRGQAAPRVSTELSSQTVATSSATDSVNCRRSLTKTLAETPVGVIIEGATSLRNADNFFAGKSDPYCICEVVDKPRLRFKTRTITDDLNPIWNHKFVLPGLEPEDVLEFTVMDKDFGREDELLGKARLLAKEVAGGFSGELPLSEDGQGGIAKLKVTIKQPGVGMGSAALVLWPTWATPHSPSKRASESLLKQAFRAGAEKDLCSMGMTRTYTYDISVPRSPGVMHPECSKRLVWDIWGLFALMIDLIWLPMQVFEPTQTLFVNLMTWSILLYWTGDILASFHTGFYTRDTVLVMTRRMIAINYIKTWFFLDLAIVSVDWLAILASFLSAADSASVARSAKLVRVTRIARLLRLMRLMKLRKVLFSIEGLIDSEWLTIVLAVVKNLMTILFINHLLACIWFWLGDSEGTSGWVAQAGLSDADFSKQYLVSLQWSLAQFTPGATPVQPSTTSERILVVTVLALALVIATCFVSSITSTMAAVWNANRYDCTQHLLLKKFLNQNKISRGLGSRIMHYVDFTLEFRHRRVHISKVHFLGLISGPLNIELHTELFAPTLCWHPCFSQILTMNKPMMREICTTAVLGTQNYAKNDMLFERGKEAKHMLFLTLGTLVYRFWPDDLAASRKVRMHEGSWFVEASLWMPWQHVGEMKALSEVDLVLVTSAKFRDICESYPEDFPLVRSYALLFWSEAHDQTLEALTDLGFPLEAHNERSAPPQSMVSGQFNMAQLTYAEEVQAQLLSWDD